MPVRWGEASETLHLGSGVCLRHECAGPLRALFLARTYRRFFFGAFADLSRSGFSYHHPCCRRAEFAVRPTHGSSL